MQETLENMGLQIPTRDVSLDRLQINRKPVRSASPSSIQRRLLPIAPSPSPSPSPLASPSRPPPLVINRDRHPGPSQTNSPRPHLSPKDPSSPKDLSSKAPPAHPPPQRKLNAS